MSEWEATFVRLPMSDWSKILPLTSDDQQPLSRDLPTYLDGCHKGGRKDGLQLTLPPAGCGAKLSFRILTGTEPLLLFTPISSPIWLSYRMRQHS